MLPLWNPFINGGFAQMADPATWYPVGWLFGLFTRYTAFSLNYEYVFHLFIAGWGFFKLAHSFHFGRNTSFILSISFMLSGFFISNAQHLGWIIGLTWFVWCFYSLRTWLQNQDLKNLSWLAIFFFFMLTGGYPGITITAFYILLVQLLIGSIKQRSLLKSHWLKYVLHWLVAITVGLALAAVALVPALELSTVFRTEGLLPDASKWGLLSGALTPASLFTFFVSIGASLNHTDFWQTDFALVNCYFGLFSVLGLVTGCFDLKVTKRPLIFLLLGVFFVLLGLAETLPLRLWISHLPLWDVFRFSTLFRGFAIFFFLLSAGYGIDKILNQKPSKLVQQITLGAILFFVVLLGLFLKWMNFSEPIRWDSVPTRMASHAFIQIVFLVFFYVVVQFKIKWVPTAVMVLVIFDLGIATYWNARATVFENKSAWEVSNQISDLPEAFPKPDLKVPIGQIDEGFLYNPKMHIWANLPTMHKVPSLTGASPYYYDYQKKAQQKGWVKALNQYPVAFFQTGDLLEGDQVDTNRVMIAEKANLRLKSFGPNLWEFEINQPNNGQLVLLQNHYFHWKLTVDNQSQQITRVNGTFMAARLAGGKHSVAFHFEPNYAMPLTLLSLLTMFILLSYLLYRYVSDRFSA